MFNFSPMKDLWESPLPPMALTDYETFSKFQNQALHRCRDSGRNFDVFLDWAIRALAGSMAADSASRIFLPKTKTAPFSLDELIPISDFQPAGKKQVNLKNSYVIAPVWNNTDLAEAVEAFADSDFEDAQIDQVFSGAFIAELNLAIIDSPSDVDVPYILSIWKRGSIQMDVYTLKDLALGLRTDGDYWFLQTDEDEEQIPVLEPRMAALYNCGLQRYCKGS